ncbi:hypothetical protein ASC94_10895 [Massilia sp. Root418]|uniref:hypothetical protein n=1 Tax=Massilia sp. Root418 TaxID=1736532 RepID=UPI0006F5F3BC|nr:hypothetical protein [Massilia sp. Root418]KQW93177.1 hypothetical protein ASC94_10895 [Massilia sp. Root418]
MTSVGSDGGARSRPLCGGAPEDEAVPGQAEWVALEQWRASWRPEVDLLGGTEELRALFRRAMRHGYAAYVAGARAMPTLFALDSSLAAMWQQGFADARRDAAIGVVCQPACDVAQRA